MNEKHQLLRNAIETPDGTILESNHTHDYKTHRDEITHEIYMVDGGLSYLRRSVNKVPAKELSVSTAEPFHVQREVFKWGTYGKDGKGPKKYVSLKDLELSHIRAILETQHHIVGSYVEDLFLKELQYRGMENDGC